MCLVGICGWPLAVTALHYETRIALSAAIASTVALAWWRVSSDRLTYLRGLNIIADSFISPFESLTALYIAWVILLMHLVALSLAFGSFVIGREAAQARWHRFVGGFYERRTKEKMTMAVTRPRPFIVPDSERPWWQKYLLLYIPNRASWLYHIGFFIGWFGIVSVPVAYFYVEELHDDEIALIGGMVIWIWMTLWSWRLARLRDVKPNREPGDEPDF